MCPQCSGSGSADSLLPAPPPLGCWEKMAFHRPETPKLRPREDTALLSFLRLGWGKVLLFCFGGSPTLAVEGRMDNSTYLGVRPTRVQNSVPRFALNNNNNIIT